LALTETPFPPPTTVKSRIEVAESMSTTDVFEAWPPNQHLVRVWLPPFVP
jgi:hypothetical protein